jgi:hypothetical protein
MTEMYTYLGGRYASMYERLDAFFRGCSSERWVAIIVNGRSPTHEWLPASRRRYGRSSPALEPEHWNRDTQGGTQSRKVTSSHGGSAGVGHSPQHKHHCAPTTMATSGWCWSGGRRGDAIIAAAVGCRSGSWGGTVTAAGGLGFWVEVAGCALYHHPATSCKS